MKKTILAITMIICSVVAAMAAANTAQFIAYVADANDATCKDMSIYLESAGYTSAFDDKKEADSRKMDRVAGKPYVYTIVDSKKCGVTATNDLEGTFIVVCTTAATQYTFSFASVDGRQLYLKDHITNAFTSITTTDTYTFTAAANSTLADRFEITAEVPEEFYHDREVAIDNWGTICYPELITSVEGAVVYEIAGRSADATQIAVVPVAVENMVMGKPYLFNATADIQKFFYNPTSTVANPVAGACGLTGTFTAGAIGADGYYIVKGQSFKPVLGTSAVLANRAYLAVTDIATELTEYVPTSPVAARFFSVARGATTDEMRIENGEMRMDGKYIINGKFVIMNNNKKINVLGN
ncbi:MAG: hypothetical protein MJZ65_02775 [Paludibacteraceae bacterium]|nr:hypothetical protein [Paludibacteraceae bacterium]